MLKMAQTHSHTRRPALAQGCKAFRRVRFYVYLCLQHFKSKQFTPPTPTCKIVIIVKSPFLLEHSHIRMGKAQQNRRRFCGNGEVVMYCCTHVCCVCTSARTMPIVQTHTTTRPFNSRCCLFAQICVYVRRRRLLSAYNSGIFLDDAQATLTMYRSPIESNLAHGTNPTVIHSNLYLGSEAQNDLHSTVYRAQPQRQVPLMLCFWRSRVECKALECRS